MKLKRNPLLFNKHKISGIRQSFESDPLASLTDHFWHQALKAFQECSVSSHHLLDPDETQASPDQGLVSTAHNSKQMVANAGQSRPLKLPRRASTRTRRGRVRSLTNSLPLKGV